MYIGYTAESREAELNYLTTQCRASLKPIKVLAWSGHSIGVPILRMLYQSTVRLLIEYASPVLSSFDDRRLIKLERLQNEAMRVILNNPMQNAMIYAMRCELSLPSIQDTIREVNVVSAVRHMRSESGAAMHNKLQAVRNKQNFQGGRDTIW